MARQVFESDPGSQRYSAAGPINLSLLYRPWTITRLMVVVRTSVTTTGTPATVNDPWDRIIASLNISQGGENYVSVGNMRLAQHIARLGPTSAPRRPNGVSANGTAVVNFYAYVFHFGACPIVINRAGCLADNPYDLTGGIPNIDSQSITLSGSYGGVSDPGTGWTVNDARFSAYVWGVEREVGDDPRLYLPRAIPRWYHHSLPVTGTSSPFSGSDAPEVGTNRGSILQDALLMTTYSATATDITKPRSDQLLNSVQVSSRYFGSGPIWTVGNVVSSDAYANGAHTLSAVTASVADQGKPAEIASQLNTDGWPPTDDPAAALLGNNSVGTVTDQGLVYLPLAVMARKNVLVPWGMDLRGVGGTALQINYGIANYVIPSGAGTPQTLDILYRAFDLNPLHPDNAGL